MSTPSYAMRDSATMLRRDIRHSLRYPMMTISGVMVPIFFMLLFVGVFGNTLRAGLGAAAGAGGHYIDYLAPGVILLTASASAEATARAAAAAPRPAPAGRMIRRVRGDTGRTLLQAVVPGPIVPDRPQPAHGGPAWPVSAAAPGR